MPGLRGLQILNCEKRGLIIMCADNGVVEEGVTQTGQEVTAIVADNFTRGETSVCIMAEEAKVDLFPVDVGMATDVPSVTKKEYKVMYGTHNLQRSGDDKRRGSCGDRSWDSDGKEVCRSGIRNSCDR